MPPVAVPEQLATRSDLASDARQQIADALNPLVADALALHVKTKNYHWHVSGSHFRDYHLLLTSRPTRRSTETGGTTSAIPMTRSAPLG